MINLFCKKPLLECSFQPASLCGGATRRTPSCCPHPTCFNPRAREGSTLDNNMMVDDLKGFNPRAREGSTSGCVSRGPARRSFNPRAREGST